MKENTKLLLVWLYAERLGSRWVDYGQIKKLLSRLSDSGIKSLLFLLKKKQFVSLEKIDGKMCASLTSHGKRALEAQFPVFSSQHNKWQGEWSVLIFLQPPKNDKNFRYLRKKVLSLRFLSLTRGVFLYPGDVPEQMLRLCDQLYRESVLIIKSKEWVFGDELQTMGLKLGLSDLKNLYSSISKEINQLIEKKQSENRLMVGDDDAMFSVFYRLYRVLEMDDGVSDYFFPQEKGFISLLKRLQEL